jgi:hypothetical protein
MSILRKINYNSLFKNCSILAKKTKIVIGVLTNCLEIDMMLQGIFLKVEYFNEVLFGIY